MWEGGRLVGPFFTLAFIAFWLAITVGTGGVDLCFLISGRVTQGKVTRSWQVGFNQARQRPVVAALFAHGGGRRGPRFYAEYDYQDASGVAHSGSGPIGGWQPPVGGQLDVTYCALAPGWSRPHKVPLVSTLFRVPFAVIGIWVVSSTLRGLWNNMRDASRFVQLMVQGVAAAGLVDKRIIEIRHGRKGRKIEVPWLEYSYLATDTQTGKRHLFPGREQAAHSLAERKEGDLLLICYDANYPARHAIDRFATREESTEALLENERNS